MIIRRITREELKRTEELFSISFEFAYDNTKSAEEVVKAAIEKPNGREDFYWDQRWAAFLDDNKTMTSYFIDKPYPMNFDGKTYVATGIGGVATLPQYRRNGGIRKCFEKALPEWYKNGVTLSYLYPFSYAYYRKFGYEMGVDCYSYTFQPTLFPKKFNSKGSCYLLDGYDISFDEALKDIKNVYTKWQHKYNCMIVNEDFEYEWVKKCNPYKNQEFTYVYRNENNEATAYISFREVTQDSERNLIASRFIFNDLDGLRGIFDLIGTLRSDHKYFKFDLPMDIYINDVIPEFCMGGGSIAISRKGMFRVVNVEEILKNAIYKGSGKVSLQINDDFIAENNHTFVVEFKNDKATKVTIDDNAKVDAKMPINQFSRLILGVIDSSSFSYVADLEIFGNEEDLAKIFYKKPSFITEYF